MTPEERADALVRSWRVASVASWRAGIPQEFYRQNGLVPSIARAITDAVNEAFAQRMWSVDAETGETTLVQCEHCREVSAAVAAERESCAQIADAEIRAFVNGQPDVVGIHNGNVVRVAAAIRARSQLVPSGRDGV